MSDNEIFEGHAFNILMDVGIDPSRLNDTVSGLLKYHTYGRHYHNTSHIVYMLNKMEEAKWTSSALSFAILFHDIYYVFGATSRFNEIVSSNMALRVLDDCALGNQETRSAVGKMIHATADFMKSCHTDEDCMKICDLDLSSLAREPYEDFVYQQREVLMEHGLGIESMHKSVGFLNSLLANRGDDLYYTEYAKKHWLKKARENISNLDRDYGS